MYTSFAIIAGIKNLVASAPVPLVFDHFGGAKGRSSRPAGASTCRTKSVISARVSVLSFVRLSTVRKGDGAAPVRCQPDFDPRRGGVSHGALFPNSIQSELGNMPW